MADVSGGQMRADLKASPAKAGSANKGQQFYALTIASVIRVDHAKSEINLLIQQGETTARESVPLTFPGAGNRHFFGAMPEPGDLCVVGWGMQESGTTKRPFIVNWIVPGTMAGYDWLPTQPYAPSEFGLSPKLRAQLEGVASRIRHKLRRLDPGNIMASSSQGADILLNESVIIANRRGNELILRDQDQAIIFRSLQQFHAGAGFRQYTGMVQRDANLLPGQMFASDEYWQAPQQVDVKKTALTEEEFSESPYTEGFMTPADVFQRDELGDSKAGLAFSADMDPYDFLQRGLFITAEGYFRGGDPPGSVYGGKPMYRVSTEGTNSVGDASHGTFTEHRVEVAHTSDGTLPVTEQTDGFDADRLPSGSPQDTDPLGRSANAPFIQSVLGSVVGNDPYTEKGREVYGIPLRPVIFEGDIRAPAMVSGVGTPIETHAATLFSIQPPLTPNARPTFWSVAKTGKLLASIAGPGDSWSVEAAFLAGIKIGTGATPSGVAVQIDADGAFMVRSKRGEGAGNIGIDLSSDSGAIRLFAGGSTTVGGLAARNAPSGSGESGLPGLALESATNVLVKAAKTLTLSATKLDITNVQELSLNANSALNFKSGDGLSHSSNTYQQSVMGKAEWTFSGPKNGLPTNGALREVQFSANPGTGFVGGTADKYRLLHGDRDEQITTGNHKTSVLVGNQTYSVGIGTYKASASGSSLQLAAEGVALISPATAKINAAGAITMTAGAAVNITATAFRVNAPAVVFTGPGHFPLGAMLTDGCINPLTGTPFKASGTFGVQTIQVN